MLSATRRIASGRSFLPGGLRHQSAPLGVRALSSAAPRPVGFMFPGQGRQRVGMAKDLYEEFPAAKKVLDEFNSQIHHDLTKTMFEGPEVRQKHPSMTMFLGSVPRTDAPHAAVCGGFMNYGCISRKT